MRTKPMWVLLGVVVPISALGQEAPRCDHHDPVWSPDSDQLAFGSNRTGDFEVFTVRRDGSKLTQRTHREGGDGGPAWSPDGGRIVFYSDRHGEGDIYSLEVGTGEVARLTTHEALDYAALGGSEPVLLVGGCDR